MECVPSNLPDDVRYGFTRTGLKALRQFSHWMAHAHGQVEPFMSEYWPGLRFQDAMAASARAGVWKKGAPHFSGIDVADHVAELHVLHDGSTRVVELVEIERRSPVVGTTSGRGGVTVDLSSIDIATTEGRRRLAAYLLGRLRVDC